MTASAEASTLSRSKVFQARKGTTSMKGTIPGDVVSGLKLKDADELEWELLPEGNRIVAKVRKVE